MRRPADSTTASPQVASCCGDLLAANSTGTKRLAEELGLRLLFQRSFFRWRSSVLKLKPRLSQNSLRRIPLLTNLTHSSASLTLFRWKQFCYCVVILGSKRTVPLCPHLTEIT